MKHKRIDSKQLNKLVREVESRHHNSVIPARDSEMAKIWNITKRFKRESGPEPTRLVTKDESEIIIQYANEPRHTAFEKQQVLDKLHQPYAWLNSRVYEYKHGRLNVEAEDES